MMPIRVSWNRNRSFKTFGTPATLRRRAHSYNERFLERSASGTNQTYWSFPLLTRARIELGPADQPVAHSLYGEESVLVPFFESNGADKILQVSLQDHWEEPG